MLAVQEGVCFWVYHFGLDCACVLRQASPFGEAPQRQEEREEGPEAPPFPPPYGVCCLIAIELRSGR